MSLPSVATRPATADLLINEQLQKSYTRAEHPKLRELAVVPLFEKFLNTWLGCDDLGVYSQQHLDESGQQVDLTVGFFDEDPLPNPVFVLLVECKRQEIPSLGELEAQLEEYGDRYLHTELGGLAKHSSVYGASAFGGKIRFFRFLRAHGYFDGETYFGTYKICDEGQYYDLKTGDIKIHEALSDIWKFYVSSTALLSSTQPPLSMRPDLQR